MSLALSLQRKQVTEIMTKHYFQKEKLEKNKSKGFSKKAQNSWYSTQNEPQKKHNILLLRELTAAESEPEPEPGTRPASRTLTAVLFKGVVIRVFMRHLCFCSTCC